MLIILLLISMALIISSIINIATYKNRNDTKRRTLKNYILNTGSIIIFILSFSLIIVAQRHGAETRQLVFMSIPKLISNIRTSHIAEYDYEPKSGDIIVYFRFGCPDCNTIYNELEEKLGDMDNVHWVSTRTQLGKELLEVYPVKEVPMIICIDDADNGLFTQINPIVNDIDEDIYMCDDSINLALK